jgi:protein-S-isoprenylcysteine O-methyltransferase
MLALVGAALTVGQVRAVLAVIVALYSFSIKMNVEEALMTRQFPQEYPEYRKKVKKLIPFIF